MLADLINGLGNINKGLDSDFSDRLNFRTTCVILVSMGILVTTRQFVGDSIICWSATFSSHQSNYADAYCWIANTRYHADANLLSHAPYTGGFHVRYYQWTPLILFMMALLFTLPHVLWQSLYQTAGINFEEIVKMATSFETQIDSQQWGTVIDKTARHIDRYLELQKQAANTWCSKLRILLTGKFLINVSRHQGNFLTYAYPVIKILFIVNILTQYYWLTLWIGPEYRLYGFTVIQRVLFQDGSLPEATDLFPRVTWCNVNERRVEALFSHNLHCVLPINMFNEVVFLFVWFWLLVLFVVSTISFLQWFANCTKIGGYDYIRKHLKFVGRLRTTEEKKFMKHFLRGYLKSDGIFIIKLMSRNASSIFISDLVVTLFDMFILKSRHNSLSRDCMDDFELPYPSSSNNPVDQAHRRGHSPKPPALLPRATSPDNMMNGMSSSNNNNQSIGFNYNYPTKELGFGETEEKQPPHYSVSNLAM